MKKLNLLWLVLPIIILSACGNNNYEDQKYDAPTDQAQIDQNAIINYLIENKINAERTESGIYYTITNEGSGATPEATDVVKVDYEGRLLNDTIFDSSEKAGEPAVFPLNRVIPGWTQGIPLFKEGGKGTLFIPSGLAYGANPRPGGKIKANDPLIFDVELIKVMNEDDIAEYKKEQEEKQRIRAEKQKGIDDEVLTKYIADNSLKVEKTPEGIYYMIEKDGSGKNPTIDSEVTVHYKGTLLDGSVFDSSYDKGEPITFPLKGVVPGWQIGIPLLKKGGKGTLLIPSVLAYGERGAGGAIPPNSCLKFEVELLDVK